MTWADGFDRYLGSYEVRLHRRTRTFGGAAWPDAAPGLIGPQRQLEIAARAAERSAVA